MCRPLEFGNSGNDIGSVDIAWLVFGTIHFDKALQLHARETFREGKLEIVCDLIMGKKPRRLIFECALNSDSDAQRVSIKRIPEKASGKWQFYFT
jgi:hypothetical protein